MWRRRTRAGSRLRGRPLSSLLLPVSQPLLVLVVLLLLLLPLVLVQVLVVLVALGHSLSPSFPLPPRSLPLLPPPLPLLPLPLPLAQALGQGLDAVAALAPQEEGWGRFTHDGLPARLLLLLLPRARLT